MSDKPEIVFIFPDCVGGVASFNRNIINFSSLKQHFITHVILIKTREDSRPRFTDVLLADKVSTFSFSPLENQFFVYKRFNELIGQGPGCVVTDSDLPLRTISLFNNQKTTFYLVHDYFYVGNALLFEPLIDAVIVHSSFFRDILCAALPSAYFSKSFYIPYGVEQPGMVVKQDHEKLNIVFLARLVAEKGVFELIKIENILASRNVHVKWTIIGTGPTESDLKHQWKDKNNIIFAQPASTTDVYAILKEQDILVLPTVFEGTPVSILECISNGVVPVVSDLPGGIRDIVNEQIGFRCNVNDAGSFAEAIIMLADNRTKLRELQINCCTLAKDRYDIRTAADNYFKIFLQYKKFSRKEKSTRSFLSRLDRPFIPNKLVYLLRNLRK